MSKIGYSTATKREEERQELLPMVIEPQINDDEFMRLRGFQKAVEILKEYLDSCCYPFVQGKERDDKLMKQLRVIKERYFEPI